MKKYLNAAANVSIRFAWCMFLFDVSMFFHKRARYHFDIVEKRRCEE